MPPPDAYGKPPPAPLGRLEPVARVPQFGHQLPVATAACQQTKDDRGHLRCSGDRAHPQGPALAARLTCPTGVPLAHSRRAAATCVSENFDFFTAISPSSRRWPEKVKSVDPKSSRIWQADQVRAARRVPGKTGSTRAAAEQQLLVGLILPCARPEDVVGIDLFL